MEALVTLGVIMQSDIAEQPAALERVLHSGQRATREVAEIIKRRKPRFVLFVARGTSDNAAIFAKYLVETRLGLAAGLTSPSTFTVYGSRPDLRDVLVIGVSQSGSSPDLVEPMIRARESGAITVAVTNSPGSPLATAAEFSLDVLAGPERAVASTKAYTCQLLTLWILMDALAGGTAVDAATVPELVNRQLAREHEVAELSVRYRFAEQMVLTARGFNYPTAREASLKLTETTFVVASGFSGADLLHGPVAMINRGFPVIAIAPEGAGAAALRPVISEVHQRGADILVVGDTGLKDVGTLHLALESPRNESLSPIVAIIPMQLLALHMARARGIDPDKPGGLSKVTATW